MAPPVVHVVVGSREHRVPTAFGRWFLPLAAAGLFCLAIAIVLSISPLWETSETYCRTLASPTNGCPDVLARRRQWVLGVLAIAVALTVLAVIAGRGRPRHPRRIGHALSIAMLLAAVGLGIAGGVSLVVGSNNDRCGSTLSRLDDDSVYDSARHRDCAPILAADRRIAWVLGLSALAVFVGASWSEVRRGANTTDMRRTWRTARGRNARR